MATANAGRTKARTTARKSAAAPATAAADFEPIELTTEGDSNDEKLVHLFSVNGTPYHVSGAQDIGMALRYVKIATTQSQERAILWLLESVLTPEGFDALCSIPRLKPESLAKVAAAVQKLLLGGMEAPKV